MSFKIKADTNFAKSVVVQGKNTGTQITSNKGIIYSTDVGGEITVPLVDKDSTNFVIREFPLSQFGSMYDTNLNISTSGMNVTFNSEIPVFMAGIYGIAKPTTLTLTNPNATYYVYSTMNLGSVMYNISTVQIAESQSNMFIGTVHTSSGVISFVNINNTSRFGLYRASTTNIGSAFPVSEGHPIDPGTINW